MGDRVTSAVTSSALSNPGRFVALALWFIALPYLARLPLGLEWALQYLPDEGKLLFGLAFFSAFNCIPALVAMVAFANSKKAGAWVGAIPFLVMSVATILAHWNYDLASDAQAAIWLIVAPVAIALLGGVVFAVSYVLSLFLK
jgi:hypothetical protein